MTKPLTTDETAAAIGKTVGSGSRTLPSVGEESWNETPRSRVPLQRRWLSSGDTAATVEEAASEYDEEKEVEAEVEVELEVVVKGVKTGDVEVPLGIFKKKLRIIRVRL